MGVRNTNHLNYYGSDQGSETERVAATQVGDEVQLASGAEARVAEVTDDWITIDANHELAGKTLHYDVELLELTKVLVPGLRWAA